MRAWPTCSTSLVISTARKNRCAKPCGSILTIQALARLATRLRDRLHESDRTQITALLANQSLPDDSRSKLLFGLAQVFDAQGQFDRAATLLDEANALQHADLRRKGKSYDRASHRRHVDAIIAAFTPEFFTRVANSARRRSARSSSLGCRDRARRFASKSWRVISRVRSR